jgi:hypothetical protein
MNSSDEKNEMPETGQRQPDDTQKEHFPAALNNDGNSPDRERDRTTRPVRVDREQAEQNLPPDPDPDDPVSP